MFSGNLPGVQTADAREKDTSCGSSYSRLKLAIASFIIHNPGLASGEVLGLVGNRRTLRTWDGLVVGRAVLASYPQPCLDLTLFPAGHDVPRTGASHGFHSRQFSSN
jgi:hypothetical protein